MTPRSSPFDDPEFRRAMQQAGIQYRPGLGPELLDQLAPLLAADGIDFDNLGDLEPEQLDAAMSRAVEHHNLTLFTPTGRHHELALAVLRAVAESLPAGADTVARVLDTVPTEPTDVRPAASHVIGLCLGLIDRWEPDAALEARLRGRRIPKLPGRRIATDLLAVASRRRAFDSMQSFIIKHGGEMLMHGAALAAAASVVAVAEHDGVDVARALQELTGASAEELADVGAGSAFGIGGPKPAERVDDSQSRIRFVDWLENQYGEDSPMVDAQLEVVDSLLSFAAQSGLDPRSAADTGVLATMLAEMPDADTRLDSLDALLDYANFCYDDSGLQPEWAAVLEQVDELMELDDALDGADEGAEALLEVIDEESSLPPEQLEAAIAKVRPVAAVRQLLDWLGASKPVTGTGSIRRADIGAVAAMLGIRAEGVASLPASPEPGVHFVKSMRDLAPLDSWWEALLITEVIELTSSRVRPGDAVLDAEPPVAPQTASMLASAFVAQLVTHSLDLASATPEERAYTQVVVLRVEELLEADRAPEDGVEHIFRGHQVLDEVESVLQALTDAGLAQQIDGRLQVPKLLRGVVARGLLIGRRYLLIAEDADD